MSNFLVVRMDDTRSAEPGRAAFQSGLRLARRLLQRELGFTLQRSSVQVATFPRANGTSTPLVEDERTGAWLLAAGTWFHRHGAASGNEREILDRYLCAGAEALASELEGFFCLVIGDPRSRDIFVITDIIGSFHVFFRQLHGCLALSGSSLLLAAIEPCALDETGCQEFLRTGILYEDRTFFRDVRKLGPACVFRFAERAPVSGRPYWRIEEASAKRLDRNLAVETLWRSATNAARRVSRVFPRIVCDLTGGYDSRALVGALRGSGTQFDTTVSGEPGSRDVTVSMGLARITGIRHRVINAHPADLGAVRSALAYTDGEYDLVEYSRILSIHSQLMTDYDVSLNGSFGEVARGYWWELLWPNAGAIRPLDARKIAAGRFATERALPLIIPKTRRLDLVAHFAEIIERAGSGLTQEANTVRLDNAYLRLRMQCWQGRIATSTNRLWPCLSPFMFRSVIDAMLAASPRVRRRGFLVRQMLAVHQPELARYPLEDGYPAMPFSVATAHRFYPLLGHLARKVRNRIRRRLGRAEGAPMAEDHTSVLQKQIISQLEPSSMHLAGLYGRDAICAYVSALADGTAVIPASRVLSLECTLHALEEVDARCTA